MKTMCASKQSNATEPRGDVVRTRDLILVCTVTRADHLSGYKLKFNTKALSRVNNCSRGRRKRRGEWATEKLDVPPLRVPPLRVAPSAIRPFAPSFLLPPSPILLPALPRLC